MSCPNCTQAFRVWSWGGYHADCQGCLIRALALSPRDVREAAYQRMPGINRAVAAEYRRIQCLRADQKTSP